MSPYISLLRILVSAQVAVAQTDRSNLPAEGPTQGIQITKTTSEQQEQLQRERQLQEDQGQGAQAREDRRTAADILRMPPEPDIEFQQFVASRNQHVNPEFLQGGYLLDFDVSGTLAKMGSVVFSGTAKYEHWNFPLLSATPKTDVSVGLQISFRPIHGCKLTGRN